MMKLSILFLAFAMNLSSCTPQESFDAPPAQQPAQPESPAPDPTPEPPVPPSNTSFRVVVGDRSFAATHSATAAAQAFYDLLPLRVTMRDLNANEKYYYLSSNLPTSPTNPGRLRNGDLMLFGSNCLVLFYEGFSSSYSYTLIGRLEDPSALPAALGSGDVIVKFEK